MKSTALLLSLGLFIISCNKKNSPVADPLSVDNGPIGGTYNFSGCTTRTYDTIPGSGISTMHEYLTTSANLKGSISITATQITSTGLMYDFTLTGSRKELNTTTGAQNNTTLTPSSGSRGASNTSYKSNYTISTSTGELTIDDAQYLFNPAFLLLPLNKKHSYVVTGNTLKITSEHYSAVNKYRSINEATFTKK